MEKVEIKKSGRNYQAIYGKYKAIIKYSPTELSDIIVWNNPEISGWLDIKSVEMEIFKKYLEFRKNEK